MSRIAAGGCAASIARRAFPSGVAGTLLVPFDRAGDFEPAVEREPARWQRTNPEPEAMGLFVPDACGRDACVPEGPGPYRLGPISGAWSRAGFIAAAREILLLIRAGDAYQVNLSHRLVAPFAGDARALADHLFARASPAFGGFLCWDEPETPRRHAVVSLSPELFLSYDAPTRAIVTRPMKGTRPIEHDPAALRDAPKDRAELDMIVDLMRNDLGRVAVPGSVRVTRPRDIDAHAGTVWQATATIEATLRDGLGPADLFAAAFPPGSVTGAPKIRATQIIRRLEPHARGPYCGSMATIRPDGSFTASVLIRTAHIVGTPDPRRPTGFLDAELRFAAGAGIVADSDPEAEWDETLAKARVLTGPARVGI